MILVGRYLSPFVRRVGVTMQFYGLPYEHKALSTMTDAAAILAINPVGRVPALVLDDGEVLVDSAAILDFLDETVGPARALTPPAGPERRRVQRLVAIAVGALEKAVAASYEKNRRPAEKVHAPWLDQLRAQLASGLAALEAEAPAPWLAGARMSQADVTAAVGMAFLRVNQPDQVPAGRYPRLDALTARLEDTPAFRATTLPEA